MGLEVDLSSLPTPSESKIIPPTTSTFPSISIVPEITPSLKSDTSPDQSNLGSNHLPLVKEIDESESQDMDLKRKREEESSNTKLEKESDSKKVCQ